MVLVLTNKYNRVKIKHDITLGILLPEDDMTFRFRSDKFFETYELMSDDISIKCFVQ